jgi:hypothetical protein
MDELLQAMTGAGFQALQGGVDLNLKTAVTRS